MLVIFVIVGLSAKKCVYSTMTKHKATVTKLLPAMRKSFH